MKTLVRPQVLATLVMLAALSQFVQPAMAQTVTTQAQTFTSTRTYLIGSATTGINAPGRNWTAEFGPTAASVGAGSDWQTGTAGRRLHVYIEISSDGGQTWFDVNANDFTTGQYGKGGFPNPPVLDAGYDSSVTFKLRVAVVALDAPVTCALTAAISSN